MNALLRSASVLAVLATALAARADVTFSLTNVNLSSAPSGGSSLGTLTGTFTTNDARTTLVAYDIVAPAAGSFLGFRYTPVTASLTAAALPSQYFRLDSPGNLNELQLYFSNGLTATGGTLLASNSYESEPSGGNRFVSGSVTVQATPEPSALAALGLGAAAMLRRRKR